MTAFHKRSFQSRFGTMGDPAEEAFDRVFPKNHKSGLNRPPFSMAAMTPEMRYTPDRMTANAYVECMGIGRDQTLKIKCEKIAALHNWQSIGPVELFVFDQTNNLWYIGDIEDWDNACEAHGIPGVFPEGKEYWALHADHFPAEPQQFPDDA